MTDPTARPTVRFEETDFFPYLFFHDQPREHNGHDEYVAHVDDIKHCLATDLLRAMRRGDQLGYRFSALLISDVDIGFFDEEESPVTPVSFGRSDDGLTIVIDFLVDDYEDEDIQAAYVKQILTPMLRRVRMSPIGAWPDQNWASPPWLWHAEISFNTRSRALDELYEVGLDAIALLDSVHSGSLSRQTASDLIRGGHARVLVGQREGHWLDVKGQHYDLKTASGQISLAQSVTRFCNSEVGGLVVFGMTTKKTSGGEEIRAMNPLPRDEQMCRRYQQVLERRIYPPPDAMSVELISVGSEEMLILIDIPPQPEELKPFLVHGAIIDGRHEGAFISIVRRRGESSIPITAPMIHSMLAAGRALLRRGELPPGTP